MFSLENNKLIRNLQSKLECKTQSEISDDFMFMIWIFEYNLENSGIDFPFFGVLINITIRHIEWFTVHKWLTV